jgi:POT family proton-dependent oligopeptide transporter
VEPDPRWAMPGGWLGDRVRDPRKTVAISSFVIMIGHALLATGVDALFFAGLVFIGRGSGLLKADTARKRINPLLGSVK